MPTSIRRILDADVQPVVALSLAAWTPVFAGIEQELGSTLNRMLFPDWRATQAAAVEAVCRSPEHEVWVAVDDGDRPVGFVALRYGDEDATRAGEIDMVAVDPRCQRGGIGAALVKHAVDEIRAAGVGLAVLGTGGDPGHAPARALYEAMGFRPYRMVRYYQAL
jgi:ribosomal protein S18 acetylase RimI-like enzyme